MTPSQEAAFRELLRRFKELRITLSGDYGSNHYGLKMLGIMDDTIRQADEALGIKPTVGKKPTVKKKSPGQELL